jgi:hypothetical protein
MGRAQLDKFFNEYVFGMFTDIQREIDCARATLAGASTSGGGNFLAALGLLCYTEALGKIAKANEITSGEAAFDGFFDSFASGEYKTWRENWEQASRRRVYDVFRDGMAHEYLPKKDARVLMLGDALPGLGQDDPPDGPLYFFVEAYFRDFRNASRKLYKQLTELQNPQIPML